MSSGPVRLRVPQEDGQVLAHPPLDRAPDLIAANRALLHHASVTLLGRPLGDLRRLARRAAVDAAAAYLRAAGEPVPDVASDSLLLSGHQPELIHPGVWVKHFALNGLARRAGATPLNLVVDNDIARTNLLRLPARGDGGEWWIESIPFDRWHAEAPYEERPVLDEDLFAGVPDRVASVAAGWRFPPLLPTYWAEATRAGARTRLLGERFATARRALERSWGCHNLELPVSALCVTEAFAWFACDLLLHLPRFHALYNEAVRSYRRLHGIRSRNHPVPDLAADGDWLEAPLWAWRAGQARRGRLMARRGPGGLELRAGDDRLPALPCGPAEATVAALQALAGEGVKLRTRALTTTLFARLLLGDLFLHGIGGGTYDELTDALLRRYHGVEPPGFVVLSATLLLPLGDNGPWHNDRRRLEHDIRDLEYNVHRRLPADAPPAARELARRKEELIAARPGMARARREWFRELRRLTDELRGYVGAQLQAMRRRLEVCRRELQAGAVRRRRDYAFCLYPEAQLRDFCTQFLR